MGTKIPVTYLFVPADRPERYEKALASGSDRIIIDLEDAVRIDAKQAARMALRHADIDWERVVVRMNPAGSQFFEEDLLAVAETKVTTILLPKAERQSDIVDLLNALEREVEVIPQIETAKGLNELDQLLLAPCVRRVAFGHLDMAVDLGTANDWDSLVLARQTLVWRSRLHHKDPPIDSVTPAIDASEVFREAASAKRFGFGGKLLIHPKQVGPTLKAFAPSDQEVEWARKVLAALENSYGSAVAVDGKMVDKPVEDAAKRVLAALTTSEVDQSLYALIDKDKN